MLNTNVSHGGSAGMMHAPIIYEVEPHPRILHVGDNRVMYYVEGNNGAPFGWHWHNKPRLSMTGN
jgi:hypothetical protein